MVSAAHGIERWTAILDDSLLDGLNQLTGGAVHPFAASRPHLGSAGSAPITVRMRPAEGDALLRRLQRVGAGLSIRAAFDPRLEEEVRALQSWA